VCERAVNADGWGPLRKERMGRARGKWRRQDGPIGQRERGSGDAQAWFGADRRGPPVRGRVSVRASAWG
jgi:hypothetical protein